VCDKISFTVKLINSLIFNVIYITNESVILLHTLKDDIKKLIQ